MRLIDRHKPTRLDRIVGKTKAIARIEKAVDQNNGFGGLVLMLTGKTGNGKTLIADLIAATIDGELYRPDCTKDAETSVIIDQIRRDVALGLGVHNFHDTRDGVVPIVSFWHRTTLFPLMFPYMEQQALMDTLDEGLETHFEWWRTASVYGSRMNDETRKGWGSVAFMKCPSRRSGVAIAEDRPDKISWDASPGPQGDYAAVIAMRDTAGARPDGSNISNDGHAWLFHYVPEHPGCSSLFVSPFRVSVASFPNWSKWSCRDTMAWWSDGTSNQLLIGEKHIPLGQVGRCDFGEHWITEATYCDCSYLMGGMNHGSTTYSRPLQMYWVAGTTEPYLLNPPLANPRDHASEYGPNYGFGSYHPGVCNFLLGDGAVRGISTTASLSTIARLADVSDGTAVSLP